MSLVEERVSDANAGTNEKVLCRLKSGWAVIGDLQFLEGYCLLLPDPVVPSLNDLNDNDRLTFLNDMALIGDAVLEVTQADRINYEILGNSEPEFHAHIFPRFADEPDSHRTKPVWFYDWENTPVYSPSRHADLFLQLRDAIQRRSAGFDRMAQGISPG